MRGTIVNNKWNTTEWGLSFQRASSFPLDPSAVFDTTEEFHTYLLGQYTDKPYLGQIIAVKEQNKYKGYIVQSYNNNKWEVGEMSGSIDEGTIRAIAAEEVAKVVANAPEDYDTLKEIADYIDSDKTNAAQINNSISNINKELEKKSPKLVNGKGVDIKKNSNDTITISIKVGTGLKIDSEGVISIDLPAIMNIDLLD